MTAPDARPQPSPPDARYMDYADYMAIKAAWEARRDELERIIYDCVSLTDIMRNGHSEELYRAIVARYSPDTTPPAGDE